MAAVVCACDAVAMPTTSAATAPVFTRPDSMRSSRQVSLVVGDSARLRCEARGLPAPEVVWYKDDAILDGAGQRVTWSLRLDHVTVEDAGMYTCVVYNHVGTISFSYNVTVRSRLLFFTVLQFYVHFLFLCFPHPTVSAKSLCFRTVPFVRLSRYLMNGLTNFDKTEREYSLASLFSDDLIRCCRSKVKGQGYSRLKASTSTRGRRSTSSS